MRHRKGLTLIELLVVIGIIVIVVSILLVAVNRARRSAAVSSEKLDFQAIAAALENYRADFGDYPRNAILTQWPPPGFTGPTPPQAPGFLSLATALLGPAPGVPQFIQSDFIAGDGFDGPGIRTQTMNIPASVSGNTITFNAPLSVAPIYTVGQSDWWFDQEQQINGITTHTLFGIIAVSSSMPPTTTNATVTWSPSTGPNSATGVLRIATGKVWGPYLPTDRFQVSYVDPLRAAGSQTDNANNPHQPVLLDRWGGVIQYFPRYGPMTNRMNASSYQANFQTAYGMVVLPTGIVAGPLFGFATPDTIDTTTPLSIIKPYGSYSIFDQRDGAPIVDNSNPSSVAVYTWASGISSTVDFSLAIKWMLGDNNLDNFVDAYTDSSGASQTEQLRDVPPYILISSGPDGPNRPGAGYCNLLSANVASNASNAQALYSQTFQASGNIYNFDR
ncbi:MAG: prepilin-type N-terminal cleavage/methylation domain-containing protein [Tepidisphaeraceae bacterium]|jgi:prepilin-type N-terminal cleavage/methylation domain-containing protein